MTLRVDPEAVRHYGLMLSRSRDDAHEGKAYFARTSPRLTRASEGGSSIPSDTYTATSGGDSTRRSTGW